MSAAPRSAAATVCAGKQFNRGAAFSPVELTYFSFPRFSVSVLLPLARRSVLHDKARCCRSVREPFLSQNLLRES